MPKKDKHYPSCGNVDNCPYFHICDYCEQREDGKGLLWQKLPGKWGGFKLCDSCFEKLELAVFRGETPK